MLATTLLAGALLLQTPAEAGSYAEPQGLAAGAPQWFATEDTRTWGFRNFLPRVGVQHLSEGYGYDRGYTNLEAFVPVIQSDFDALTALQGNWLIDNGGEMGCNLGVVQRWYFPGIDRVFGVNAFYDHRREDGSSFNQVGVGFDTLGNYLDWRLNGYFPVGDDLFPADGASITNAVFSGRRVLVNFLANKALTGMDTELGGIVPGTLDILRGYVGCYTFGGPESDNLVGVQARLEVRLQDSLLLHAGVTNDDTFGTNYVVAAGLFLPGFAPRNTPPFGRAQGRLAEKLYRNHNIIVERSPMRDPVPARWADGSLIDVVHVNSNAVGPGTGAVNNPFQTLTVAQLGASNNSILFAHANSVFTGENVSLLSGQQLLGEGLDHTINSLYGAFLLPTVTPRDDVIDVPHINNAPGASAVTVASHTVVSGFRIQNAAGRGVFGDGVVNVALNGLDVNNAGGDGIVLVNAAGDLSVTNNFVRNSDGHGVVISTAAAGDNVITITDNAITGNPGIGIHVTTNGTADNVLYLERNRVFVSLTPFSMRFDPADVPMLVLNSTELAPLVQINTLGNSKVTGRASNNLFDDTFTDVNNDMDDDPYFDHVQLNIANSSVVDLGFANNRMETNRTFDAPASGPYGIRATSTDLARLRLRLDTNTADLNFAISENFISSFQVEDTLTTNTGTFYYFPSDVFIDVIPDGTIVLP